MSGRVLGRLGAGVVVLFLAAGSFVVAAPAGAQTAAGGLGKEVSGVFRLTLSGRPAEGYSFYADSSVGSGGGAVICSTDPSVVASGVKRCTSGLQEVPFTAREGEKVTYRILGNPGNELGQFTVASGTVVASDGMTLDGSYNFPADQKTPAAGQYQNGAQGSSGSASGTQEATTPTSPPSDATTEATTAPATAPATTAQTTSMESTGASGSQATTTTPTAGGFGTTAVQTTGAQASGAATTPQTTTPEKVSSPRGPVGRLLSFGGLLPESGGTSILLGAGVLLLAVGGFLFRRAVL